MEYRTEKLADRLSASCAFLVGLIGLVVLVGWIFNIEYLKSVFPGLVSMKANTAIAFVAGGFSLILLVIGRSNKLCRSAALVLALIVLVISAATLSEYIFNIDLGIDQIFFKESPGAAGISFATGLRSILRQDPNIIMVGEIRDKETADIAIQASLTGHLVFSTLHTNDASSAITRLAEMGIEPFLISSSVIAILAQRLVRKICPACKEKYAPSPDVLKNLSSQKDTKDMVFYKGKGCNTCKDTGYQGRVAIYELLTVTEEIRKLIVKKSSAEELKKKAVEEGMSPLREDGLDKIQQGITTVEEVVRVTEE